MIEAKGVSKAYGDKLLMSNLDFSIPPGYFTDCSLVLDEYSINQCI